MVEAAAFVPHLSGLRNLRLWWEAAGAKWRDADVDGALGVAGLGDAVDRKVRTYSQGMKQRLGFARLLLGRPELLVLDEPTNGLDPGEIREIRELIGRLTATGATVLLSSHHLSEVEQVCTHLVVMNRGRLVRRGTVSELIGSSGSVYIEVDDRDRARAVLAGLPDVASVHPQGDGILVDLPTGRRSDLAAALVSSGLRLETIMPTQRLEDAFLELLEQGADGDRLPGAGGGGAVIALVRTEFVKAAVRMRSLVVALLLVGLPTLIVVAINARGRRADSDNGEGLFRLAQQSGLLVPAAVLSAMSGFLLVVVAGTFAGDSVASDATWGNLRYLLMRPVPRGRLLVAKAAVAGILIWTCTVLVALAGLVAGVLLFGSHSVVVPTLPGISGFELGSATLLFRVLIATVYVAFGFTALLAIGTLFSTLTDTATAAVGATIGVYIVSEILDGITQLGEIRYAFPTHYMGAWQAMFTQDRYSERHGGRRRRPARLSGRVRHGGRAPVPQDGHPVLTRSFGLLVGTPGATDAPRRLSGWASTRSMKAPSGPIAWCRRTETRRASAPRAPTCRTPGRCSCHHRPSTTTTTPTSRAIVGEVRLRQNRHTVCRQEQGDLMIEPYNAVGLDPDGVGDLEAVRDHAEHRAPPPHGEGGVLAGVARPAGPPRRAARRARCRASTTRCSTSITPPSPRRARSTCPGPRPTRSARSAGSTAST